jgi:hypothetical protein
VNGTVVWGRRGVCAGRFGEIGGLGAQEEGYRSQSWEVRETMSLGYPKLMVN